MSDDKTTAGVFVPAYRDQISSQLVHSVLQDYAFCARAGWDFRYFAHDVQPIDRARNTAIDRARTMGLDYLMMYDADTYCDPRASALEHLHLALEGNERAAAAGAVVVLRSGAGVNVDPVHFDQVYPCEKVGAAVMLIDMRRLHALGPEHCWFRYQVAENGIDAVAGEDVYFCREVQRLGGEVLAAYTVPTRHVGTVPLRLEQWRPA